MFGKVKFVLAAGLALAVSSISYGQNLNSTAATVALNATLAESLTVSASANTLSIPLTAGAKSAPAGPLTITTAWVLKGTRNNVQLVSYLSSSTAALSDGTNNIPASAVQGQVNSGTYNAYTNGASNGIGLAGATLNIGTTAITNTNRNSSRTDTLNIEVDLSTGSLPQLPASTYTGTLNLQAVAY